MRISVVLASYNGEKYIEEQIQSILQQTFPPDELLIADDQSSDGTWEIVSALAVQQQSILAIRNSERLDVNQNVHQLLRRTTGDVVFIADQDDIWFRDKIEYFCNRWSGEAVLFSDAKIVDASGEVLHESELTYLASVEQSAPLNTGYFLFSNCASGHNMMLAGEFARSVPKPPASTLYDHWYALCAAACNSIGGIDKPLIKHRLHAHNRTNRLKGERAFRGLGSAPDRLLKRAEITASMSEALLESNIIESNTLLIQTLKLLLNRYKEEPGPVFNFRLYMAYQSLQRRDRVWQPKDLIFGCVISFGLRLFR